MGLTAGFNESLGSSERFGVTEPMPAGAMVRPWR